MNIEGLLNFLLFPLCLVKVLIEGFAVPMDILT
jgi:hypothetical protein